MKNVIKSRKVLVGIISIILIVILIFFVMFFKKDNDENIKLKGSVSEFTNYSDGFTDIGFYSCVVNAYNLENNTNYTVGHKLSKEQLGSIKTLVCNTSGEFYKYDMTDNKLLGYAHPTGFEDPIKFYKNNKILPQTDEFYTDYVMSNFEVKNIDGISNLTNLKKFVIYLDSTVSNNIDIDLSNNLNIEYLDLHLGEKIDNLILTNNIKLNTLLVDMYNTSKIVGLEQLTNLTELHLKEIIKSGYSSTNSYNELTSLTNLKKLVLNAQGFYDMSIINNLLNLEELSFTLSNTSGIENFKFGDISILTNLKKLYYSGAYEAIGEFPLMENLEELNLGMTGQDYWNFSSKVLNFDFSKVPNVKKLSIPGDCWFDGNGDGWTPYFNLYDIKNFSSLTKLEYLRLGSYWENFGNLSFPNLKTIILEDLYRTRYVNFSESMPSVETIYGNVRDYSKTPNLKNLYNTILDTATTSNDVISNLKELYIAEKGSNSNYLSVLPAMKELEEIYYTDYGSLKFDSISISPKLRVMFVGDHSIKVEDSKIDVSKNINLETIILSSTYWNLHITKELVGVENLTKLKHCHRCQILDTDLSNNTALEYLDLYNKDDVYDNYIVTEKLDFSNSKNLRYLNLKDVRINAINIFDNLDLRYLKISNSDLFSKLDLSKLKKLSLLDVYGFDGSFSKSLFLGLESEIQKDVVLPKQFLYKAGESEYIELKNGKLIGKKVGESYFEINVYNTNPSAIRITKLSTYDTFNSMTISINASVKELFSNNMLVDNESQYIFTNGFLKEKNIIDDIYFIPYSTFGILYGFVNNNNFSLFDRTEYLGDYKLVKVSSDIYKVDKDTITYYGDFNIDNINVTNADKVRENDKLIIKYNDKVVKEYSLIQDNSLKGDTNSDGLVTISDMILQYKHVKYDLDLVDSAFYRADINSDEDVEKKDVNLLYEMLKANN